MREETLILMLSTYRPLLIVTSRMEVRYVEETKEKLIPVLTPNGVDFIVLLVAEGNDPDGNEFWQPLYLQ